MSEDMIRTEQLTKQYGALRAVDQLNWTVPSGSICGLLGPNGAGKTTTLKLLLGIAHPSSGSGFVAGHHISSETIQVRHMTAFLPEDKLIYDNMRVGEFLNFYSSLFPGWSAENAQHLLSQWRIDPESKINSLSRGSRSKLLLIAATARNSNLLLLDEPTEGLDPAGIEDVLKLLAAWASENNRTAVVATHRLDEVERICDHVTIIDRGKLLLNDNLDDLRKSWKTIHAIGEIPVDAVRKWKGVHSAIKEGIGITMIASENSEGIIQELKNFHVSNLELFDMNLREIYLSVTAGEGGKDGSVESMV
jgi:ABC-2 type transport system ATP-binding protein